MPNSSFTPGQLVADKSGILEFSHVLLFQRWKIEKRNKISFWQLVSTFEYLQFIQGCHVVNDVWSDGLVFGVGNTL